MLVRSNYHQTSPELCFSSQLCHWDQLDQLGNSSRVEFKTTWVLLRLTLHLNLAGWQRTLMDSLNSPKFRGAMFNYTFPILPGQPAIPRPRIPRYSKNWECWSQSNSKPWIIIWAMNHPHVCLHILKPNGLSFFCFSFAIEKVLLCQCMFLPKKMRNKSVH